MTSHAGLMLLLNTAPWLVVLASASVAAPPKEQLSESELTEHYSMSVETTRDKLSKLFDFIVKPGQDVIDEKAVDDWVHRVHAASNLQHAIVELEYIDANHDGLVQKKELIDAMKNVDSRGFDDESEFALSKRFDHADADQNKGLNEIELATLLNPGSNEEMTLKEAKEVMKTQDKDTDGFLSFDEFVGEIKHDEDTNETVAQREANRQYHLDEQQKDFEHLDMDGNGLLSEEEIKAAFLDPHPRIVQEAIDDCRQVCNGPCTKEAFVDGWPILVKSSVTDQGEILRTPKNYKFDQPLPFPGIDEDEFSVEDDDGEL